MQILKMNCPNCGASLTYTEDQKDIVCSYCDSHVKVHNENEHVVHIVDDAELLRMQMEREEVENRRIEEEQNRKKKRIKLGIWLGGSALLLVIGIVGINVVSGIAALCFPLGIISFAVGGWYYKDKKGAAQGKIRIPLDLGNYSDKHYKEIEARFRQLGFTNIQTIPLDDVVVGLIRKNGYVAGVTVSGRDPYAGFRFFPTAPVIIKYHSYHS